MHEKFAMHMWSLHSTIAIKLVAHFQLYSTCTFYEWECGIIVWALVLVTLQSRIIVQLLISFIYADAIFALLNMKREIVSVYFHAIMNFI